MFVFLVLFMTAGLFGGLSDVLIRRGVRSTAAAFLMAATVLAVLAGAAALRLPHPLAVCLLVAVGAWLTAAAFFRMLRVLVRLPRHPTSLRVRA